ncbi:MAG: 50S ribosomal protein L1 [Candidatus Woesearchaeota archaeon]|jgi:large subunit ribosomal protein L1|nr:50S ribosomal protein L1 [Candidatus Woesearchaeota archaeon]
MNKNEVIETLKLVRANSKKRNFKQSVDLIINLKDLDLKNPDHQVTQFIQLHFSRGKKAKVCALVGPELLEQAKEVCDLAVSLEDFPKYQDKKVAKKLANGYDFFIAQATIMPKIATTFGRVFGPKGKMPNPKAGCVVPPNASLKPLYERLQQTIKLATINDAILQCSVGKEDMKDEELVDNIMTIYNSVLHSLPNESHNIKEIIIKFTMDKSYKVGAKPLEEQKGKEKPKAIKEEKEDKPQDPKSEEQTGEKPEVKK